MRKAFILVVALVASSALIGWGQAWHVGLGFGGQTNGGTGAGTTGAGTTGAAGAGTTGAAVAPPAQAPTTPGQSTTTVTPPPVVTGPQAVGSTATPASMVGWNSPQNTGTTSGDSGMGAFIASGAFPTSKFFGLDYFIAARQMVVASKATGTVPGLNAATGPFTYLPTPDTYRLGPGDKLHIRLTAPALDEQNIDVAIDPRGALIPPYGGQPLVLRGLTVTEAEKMMKKAAVQYIKGADLTVTLTELRSMQISIVGESYSPGTYQVPSNTTLYNALYYTGGPSDNGGLRKLEVRRQNGQVLYADFYRFLLKGDARGNIPLEPGDVIVIPTAGQRVAVVGEVNRAAIYEALATDRVKDVLAYANGLKVGAVSQRISVESIKPGVARVLIDVNVNSQTPAANPLVFDGNIVAVSSVRNVLTNAVELSGAVDQPGKYEITPGMTVKELITKARGTLNNAYLGQADLVRLNADGTQKFIRIDLNSAMKGGPSNVALKPNDRVHIYTIDDVQWMGERKVTVTGAVRNAGVLARADGMTVRDALLQAGGLTPDVSLTSVFVQRTLADGKAGDLIRLDLNKVIANDSKENIVLQDRDTITLFGIDQVNFPVDQSVSITGAVQRPRIYRYSPNMRIQDLIELAGNFLPNAFKDFGYVQRLNRDGSPGPIIPVNLRKLYSGDKTQNILLKEQDTVTIYTVDEWMVRPKRTVTISGSVQRPGQFDRSEGLTLKDLVNRSGNLTPNAYQESAVVSHYNLDGSPGLLTIVNLRKALAGDVIQNIVLKDLDQVQVYSIDEWMVRPKRLYSISGAVQRPGQFDRADKLTLKEAIARSGNLLPTASLETVFVQRFKLDGTPGQLLTANLGKLLAGDDTQNIDILDNDVITVKSLDETRPRPSLQVEIQGAVLTPGQYPRSSNMKLSQLIALGGNFLYDAYLDKAFLTRTNLDKTPGPLLTINLRRLMAGDTTQDIVLQDDDVLKVLHNAEANYTPPQTIDVVGAVQTPGTFTRSENMRLRDALLLAGGLLPTTADTIEIAKSRVKTGTRPIIIKIADLLAGKPDANVALDAGDLVMLHSRSDIELVPRKVVITGAVQKPGPYVIASNKERLSDVIARAGGLTQFAFPEGTGFARNPSLLINDLQTKLAPPVLQLLRDLAADEYKRALAQSDVQKLQLTNSTGSSNTGVSLIPAAQQIGGAVQSIQGPGLTRDSVTPARDLKDITPSGNMSVDVVDGLRHPHGVSDIMLQDGDVINIPEKPTTVAITGAVFQNSTIQWIPGRDVRFYAAKCGDPTRDADLKGILIIKATGRLEHAGMSTRLDAGDIVIIPTRVVAQNLTNNQSALESLVHNVTNAAVIYGVIKALSK